MPSIPVRSRCRRRGAAQRAAAGADARKRWSGISAVNCKPAKHPVKLYRRSRLRTWSPRTRLCTSTQFGSSGQSPAPFSAPLLTLRPRPPDPGRGETQLLLSVLDGSRAATETRARKQLEGCSPGASVLVRHSGVGPASPGESRPRQGNLLLGARTAVSSCGFLTLCSANDIRRDGRQVDQLRELLDCVAPPLIARRHVVAVMHALGQRGSARGSRLVGLHAGVLCPLPLLLIRQR